MTIRRVALVGGTHGNELTGVSLIRKWQSQPDLVARPSFKAECLIANPEAVTANKRYLDVDLNRQFSLDRLSRDIPDRDACRARELNRQLGPKGAAVTDMIIDLHTTTANMGCTLVITSEDAFHLQMCAWLSLQMPSAFMTSERALMEDHHFLSSISDRNILVEVGPVPQGLLRADAFSLSEKAVGHILDFIELYNRNALPALPGSLELYRYFDTVPLPVDGAGELAGMVHPQLQDQDFRELTPGQPILQRFDGSEITWQGPAGVYASFINEAAYYDQKLAFSLLEKVTVDVPAAID